MSTVHRTRTADASRAPLLELRNVYSGYGEATVLEGVDCAVEANTCVVLLGPNGAGKSTLLRTISGVIKPTAGTVLYKSRDLKRVPDYQIARRGIAHVPEGRGIFPGVTVLENLRLGAFAARRSDAEFAATLNEVFGLFPVLSERASRPAAALSGGQQQMLAIGRGLMSRPELLILDEPSLGLSPLLVDQVFDALRSIKERGTTLLLVEQNAPHALALANHVYVMSAGRVVRHGTADEVKSTLDIEYLS